MKPLAKPVKIKIGRHVWYSVEMLPEAKGTRIHLERTFTKEEYEQITRGHQSEGMEDRWNLFFQDDWLSVCRNSTGFCLYRVRLEPVGEDFRVAEAWVNRDPRLKPNEFEGVRLLEFLIDRKLLGRDVQFS